MPGNDLFKLIKQQRFFTAAALFPVLRTVPVESKVSGDLAQICPKIGGACRRNGIPGFEPGVVYAFLCVIGIAQDIHRDRAAVCAVLFRGLMNGQFISVQIKL